MQHNGGQQTFRNTAHSTPKNPSEDYSYVLVSAGISSDLFCEVGNDKRSLYIKGKSPIYVYYNKSGQDTPC